MFASAGSCPHCGAPMWSPSPWGSVLPPPVYPSCACGVVGGYSLDGGTTLFIQIPAEDNAAENLESVLTTASGIYDDDDDRHSWEHSWEDDWVFLPDVLEDLALEMRVLDRVLERENTELTDEKVLAILETASLIEHMDASTALKLAAVLLTYAEEKLG